MNVRWYMWGLVPTDTNFKYVCFLVAYWLGFWALATTAHFLFQAKKKKKTNTKHPTKMLKFLSMA